MSQPATLEDVRNLLISRGYGSTLNYWRGIEVTVHKTLTKSIRVYTVYNIPSVMVSPIIGDTQLMPKGITANQSLKAWDSWFIKNNI